MKHRFHVLVPVNIVSLIYVPLVLIASPAESCQGPEKKMSGALIRSRPGRGHEFSSSESKRPRKPLANAANPRSRPSSATFEGNLLRPRRRMQRVSPTYVRCSFAGKRTNPLLGESWDRREKRAVSQPFARDLIISGWLVPETARRFLQRVVSRWKNRSSSREEVKWNTHTLLILVLAKTACLLSLV